MDEECPGEGKCHGCLAWCNECGEVSEVCNYSECDQHHCIKCRALLEGEEKYYGGGVPTHCFACCVKDVMENALRRNRDEVAAGELELQRIKEWCR